MLKKIIIASCVFVFALFFHITAQAKIIEPRQHGLWSSFVLSDEKIVCARIITQEAVEKNKSALSLDFSPVPQCADAKLRIMVKNNNPNVYDVIMSSKVSIRVDEKKIHHEKLIIEILKEYVTYTLNGIVRQEILKEAVDGKFIRFKIDIEGQKSMYVKFPLIGFADALKRGLQLCGTLEEILKKHEREDEHAPKDPQNSTGVSI